MIHYLVYIFISLASVALAFGFGLAERITSAVTVALLGVLWGVAYTRNISRLNGLGFALFVFISVVSIAADVSPWFALASITFSLMAWDLIRFLERLKLVREAEDSRKMERAHLIRLTLVIGLALLSFVTATQLRINLTFGGAALLALLAIWGISALVYRLRSHE